MIVDRYDGVLPWRIPASAPARKRSVGSSRRRLDRTSSSWASVRGWNEPATSTGTGSCWSPGPPPLPAAGTRTPSSPGAALTRSASDEPAGGVAVPGESQRREPGPGLGGRRRLELGCRQNLRERVEVVADPDPALGDRLEGRRAAAAERVEHHVAGAGVAGDERVREGRREAREVRAHRVEAVAPQAWLRLPVRLDRQGRQGARQLEGELAGGDGSRRDGSVGHSRARRQAGTMPARAASIAGPEFGRAPDSSGAPPELSG